MIKPLILKDFIIQWKFLIWYILYPVFFYMALTDTENLFIIMMRTPLTMIEGYAEAMRDIPDEITPENMQIIIDETERLSTMVNEVLDFSRLRTGSLELTMTRFNLT